MHPYMLSLALQWHLASKCMSCIFTQESDTARRTISITQCHRTSVIITTHRSQTFYILILKILRQFCTQLSESHRAGTLPFTVQLSLRCLAPLNLFSELRLHGTFPYYGAVYSQVIRHFSLYCQRRWSSQKSPAMLNILRCHKGPDSEIWC